jgi:hypothetical protein
VPERWLKGGLFRTSNRHCYACFHRLAFAIVARMSTESIVDLSQAIRDWADSPNDDFFHWVEQSLKLRLLRFEVKGAIVLLEMHGLDDDASRLENRMATLGDCAWDWDNNQRIADMLSDRAGALAELKRAAHSVAATLTDLAQEVPESVWEGQVDV